jgi:hypothetical protein
MKGKVQENVLIKWVSGRTERNTYEKSSEINCFRCKFVFSKGFIDGNDCYRVGSFWKSNESQQISVS